MKISLPFHIPKLVKSLPFYIPEAWKRCPFQAEPPHIGHYREYPPPLGHIDFLPPVTAVLYYRWLAAGLHDKIISQGIGGHRVYVGIRHPCITLSLTQFHEHKELDFKLGHSGFAGKKDRGLSRLWLSWGLAGVFRKLCVPLGKSWLCSWQGSIVCSWLLLPIPYTR